ncbi:MAG TPA: DUF485 domain-containing protein [Candidatus Ozemobacteraceae bacterium]|nr:DUF485 domain-containing protein [Candidatus Ozemobacteraceae bacterium]
MLHEPVAPVGKDLASDYKSRIGVWMFWLYAFIYASFVGINLLWPTSMENIVFMGLNLAVFYGFGLIVFALVLALIYNHLSTSREAAMNAEEASKGA